MVFFFGHSRFYFCSLITGLTALVPLDMLEVFDEKELELLIGGLSHIDANDWRANTIYRDGYTATSAVSV